MLSIAELAARRESSGIRLGLTAAEVEAVLGEPSRRERRPRALFYGSLVLFFTQAVDEVEMIVWYPGQYGEHPLVEGDFPLELDAVKEWLAARNISWTTDAFLTVDEYVGFTTEQDVSLVFVDGALEKLHVTRPRSGGLD
ncbi:hypothetical protein OJ997_03155 [Solirubrobacter phytolaccae]|uniref:Uncharacterized protein n=1 Tax=Solirubrobacter phytolaccae TaxID=1404360 RepID=A0A9X3S6M1_9ACTN|nr:hypothetical protein [Solirubrobacter phytolaccae]MDA0179283.1 hypothetical protein [Solirubrobacter phytolaccae]